MLSEITSFFDNFLQLDDIVALMGVIPTNIKAVILGGVAFSAAIAFKRMIFD